VETLSSQTLSAVNARSSGARDDAWLDRVGVVSSILCAVHCLLTPLLIAALPIVGLEAVLGDGMEWSFVLSGLALGSLSLVPSFRRVHRRFLPLALFAAGAALWMCARLASTDRWELPLVLVGATSLVTAHLVNRLLCRACRACETSR
jgi:hypothetical protein